MALFKKTKTNIGEKFLKLVDKNIPPGHPLAKIVNRNSVKISYKCIPNMKMVISQHNYQVKKLVEEQVQAEPGCNCNGGCGPCPLQGGCLVESVVYKATVEQQDSTVNTYTGMTCNTFKERFYGNTTLSRYVCVLNEHTTPGVVMIHGLGNNHLLAMAISMVPVLRPGNAHRYPGHRLGPDDGLLHLCF